MANQESVLVTGGTGLLGSAVVKQLLHAGKHDVRVLSREWHEQLPDCTYVKGDLVTGLGLTEALRGVSAIIHCASNPGNAQRVDVEGTANLLAAVNDIERLHIIYISIVGVDKTDYAYYQSKLKAETLIAQSGHPYSILRTTQFHDFVFGLLHSVKSTNGELDLPEGLGFQPVEVNEVASKLIDILGSKQQGLLPEFGGPEVLTLEQLAQDYCRASGKAFNFKSIKPSSEREKMFASKINLIPENAYGKVRWGTYLKNKLSE
ncbi:SDR family oxidoreductase [Arcticibacter sp. MXS-1]|uniref:SDR family oxidoreductase n=1 Tax=Arcticibacter sp. MXS-1 TaxID=3341726 RepID=UPI0035A963D6